MAKKDAKLTTEIVTVTVTNPDTTLKDQKKSYKVVKYPKDLPTAKIEASVGATINVGNYQSLRVDCRVMRNCLDTDEAVKDMQKSLFQQVREHLDAAIEGSKEHF